MTNISIKTVSLVLGITFIFAGVLGFIPNPLVSADGIFAVNWAHNLVHIFTGAAFVIGGLLKTIAARRTVQTIGIAYVAVSILGFLTTGDTLLGLVHINVADRWLHVGLAGAILAIGFGWPKQATETAAPVEMRKAA